MKVICMGRNFPENGDARAGFLRGGASAVGGHLALSAAKAAPPPASRCNFREVIVDGHETKVHPCAGVSGLRVLSQGSGCQSTASPMASAAASAPAKAKRKVISVVWCLVI